MPEQIYFYLKLFISENLTDKADVYKRGGKSKIQNLKSKIHVVLFVN